MVFAALIASRNEQSDMLQKLSSLSPGKFTVKVGPGCAVLAAAEELAKMNKNKLPKPIRIFDVFMKSPGVLFRETK